MKKKRLENPPLNTIVYIDGFNLYYSLKKTPYKWLNLEKLIYSVLSPSWHKIVEIKYFTARVQSSLQNPLQDTRQDIYLQAIRTLPKVTIIEGKFKRRQIKGKIIVNKPEKREQVKKIFGEGMLTLVSKYEEKETDVNIATHIIYDCCTENIEAMVLLSNDTDLKLPLWFVRSKMKKRVIIITPPTKDKKGNIVERFPHQDLKKYQTRV